MTQKETQKPAPAMTNIKLQNPGLVAFCDMWPENGVEPHLTTHPPAWYGTV